MNTEKKVKRISGKLLSLIIPMIVAGLILIIAVVALYGTRLIRNLLYTSLEEQALSDAGEINKQLNSTFYYLNGVADAIDTISFKDNDDIMNYMATSINRYSMIPTGTYLSVEDGSYIDPTGWEPGKDTRESNWYKLGMSHEDHYFYFYDVPYFDSDTGDLCATVVRHSYLQDGREGVLASDLMMATAQEYLNSVSVYESGHAIMMTTAGLILSAPEEGVAGMMASDLTDYPLLTAIGNFVQGADGEVQSIEGGDGKYFVVSQTVDGTDWKVVEYAKSSDVLRSVFMMFGTIIVVGAILIVILSITLNWIIGKMIRVPVSNLTENIERIAGGDFTVDIQANGNDEISYMNEAMKNFVATMRDTIANIQTVASRLETDSVRSKDTAGVLSDEAGEQSNSMEQILDSMDSMSLAVTEVAENATTLAQTVAALTDAEAEIESSMNELVEKADEGQHEMVKVSHGMNDIVNSMAEMNTAVEAVDDAAKQIDSIVDMINSIASQTNLLSLNASIEAARAGEAGRGFAVVATEIGQLANDSAAATNQIAEIIRKMTERVRDLADKSEANTQLINESAGAVTKAADTFSRITTELSDASRTLTDMASKMESVNDVATNMASVSEEQSASTQEITSTVNRLTESSRNVAQSSGTVSNAAASVADAADEINESMKYFNI